MGWITNSLWLVFINQNQQLLMMHNFPLFIHKISIVFSSKLHNRFTQLNNGPIRQSFRRKRRVLLILPPWEDYHLLDCGWIIWWLWKNNACAEHYLVKNSWGDIFMDVFSSSKGNKKYFWGICPIVVKLIATQYKLFWWLQLLL